MNKRNLNVFYFFMLAGLSSLCCLSCHITPAVKPVDLGYSADLPLDKQYKKIILFKFASEPSLDKSFPDAAALCENSAMAELLKKSSVSRIAKSGSGSFRGAGAILVMAYLTGLRFDSGVAGYQEMSVDLKLMDTETGNIVRRKKLSAANNTATGKRKSSSPYGTLPSDLGNAIAQYLGYIIHSE